MFAFLAAFLGTAAGISAEPLKVKISLSQSDKAKYLDFMAGKAITDKITYKSPDFDSAPVLDTVLITKALTLGGLSFTLSFVDVPNSERERLMLLDGQTTIAGTSQWDFFADENKDACYKSDVIVPNGSFEKGLYTTKEKAATLKVKTEADLAQLTCASSSSWRVDWKTLQGLAFKKLEAAATIPAMFKLVSAGRVDVTVQSFSGNPDMSIVSEGVTLYPIEGVKVLLSGSRYYLVSKKSPDGAAVYDALQKGLAEMRKTNEINRALTESGFFNQRVKDWKSLQAK